MYHFRVICLNADQAQGRVVQCSPEHSALALNVQSPAAILWVGTRKEVVFDLGRVFSRDGRLGCIPSNHYTREEEHWPSIFTSPVARGQLQFFEEV